MRRVDDRRRVVCAAAVAAAAVGLWMVPTDLEAQQCSLSDRTSPPGAPAVNLMPSHNVIASSATADWFKNATKNAIPEYVSAGNCPTPHPSNNQGRSCSPGRACPSGQVCASGYRPWASCPEDAGPIEWDDEPYNGNPRDPLEGPSTANDSQDTGEQGPCFCWDDTKSVVEQRPCSSSTDCRASKICVEGRCRCPNFDWSDCDAVRFGLSVFDENGCRSEGDEFTNNMVEEADDEETGLYSMDVRNQIDGFASPGSATNYCGSDNAYRPLAQALLEFQREEKFRSGTAHPQRWWHRAHANVVYLRNLPTKLESGSLVKDSAVKDALVRAYRLLEGRALEAGTTSSYRDVPPIVTYVVHYSNPEAPSGTCAHDGDPLEVFSGMLAAVGGTGRCCRDANADGDCLDSNDTSLSAIGTPTSFYNHIAGRSASTLLDDIQNGRYRCGVSIDASSDSGEPAHAYETTRTAPKDTGSAGACDTTGLLCQLGGPESAGSCGSGVLGVSDLFEDAACLRTLPKDRAFSALDWRYCENESDGSETCIELTSSDISFLDPNQRVFQIEESIGAEGRCMGEVTVNPCPHVGDLCTTSKGCTRGVVKCVDGSEVCALPESPGLDETACDGKDGDCDGTIDEGVAIVGEAGRTTGLADDAWSGVGFDAPLSTSRAPLVFATPQSAAGGEEAPQAHVRSVSTSGFETQNCEIDTGSPATCDSHPAETNGWLAIDSTRLEAYKGIEAGAYSATSGTEVHDAVPFDGIFDAKPIVFSTVQTANESDVPRTVHPYQVYREGAEFEFCEQEGATTCGSHSSETVGWLAVNPQTNDLNGVEAGRIDNAEGSGAWTSVTFSADFQETPVVIADVQTEHGLEEALYPQVRNVTTSGAEIRYCEYDGSDACDDHVDEVVGWLAVEPGALSAGRRTACDTGKEGRCSFGTCAVGSSTACVQLKQPVPEVCNGLDEDCDGTVDNIAESWKNFASVDPSTTGNELACGREAACSCADASDRDDRYRGGAISQDELPTEVGSAFEELAERTRTENEDGDSEYATQCRCSE